MSTPSRSRSRLADVEFPRELKPVEKVKLWIERVDDFEPPIQDQAQQARPATPVAQDSVPPTLNIESAAQHETRTVILSRSRYCMSFGKAESEHNQDRDNKSVVTLSRSFVPSSPPRTPKRATPPQVKSRHSQSRPQVSPTTGSKGPKPRNHAKTPTEQTRQDPVSNGDSPLGAPRNIILSTQSRRSQSPSYSQPPSPSLPRISGQCRPISPLARAPSNQNIRHHESVIETPSIPPEVEYENEDDDFEDELEVLREQEQQEERERIRQNAHYPLRESPKDNVEDIEAELAEIMIGEQKEQEPGKIVLEERTDEEYQQLREQQLKLTQVAPSPPQSPGSFTSLFDIWSRALEAHHLATLTQASKSEGKDKAPNKKSPKIQPFIFPVSANDLLWRLENLHAHGIHLSPVFPLKGPPCQICDQPSTFGQVSAQNPNGNAYRPYYKCWGCGQWTTWADLRGVSGRGENPGCECGKDVGGVGIGRLPSRMNITGKRAAKGPGKIFFTCAEGRCCFFEWAA